MFAWNLDGIKVFSTTEAKLIPDLIISGSGAFDRESWTDLFTWQAVVTPQGWYVTIMKPSGRAGEFQGSTFNLVLEVSAAVKRLL